ncbi:MAG: hypothetical protein ISS29_01930 [Candidatus Marinimicrobia bacterium]|nr:hypothetical protein [Candidatus Neomarinimicrobiota bacterium]
MNDFQQVKKLTKNQVKELLGDSNFHSASYSRGCYMVGKYILLFNGTVLSKVVPLGQRSSVGNVVDDCSGVKIYGRNVATY